MYVFIILSTPDMCIEKSQKSIIYPWKYMKIHDNQCIIARYLNACVNIFTALVRVGICIIP